MEQLHGPLAQELARLASRIPTRSATSNSASSSPPNCQAFWSRLPREAQARLSCIECSGTGRIGSYDYDSQPACLTCRGTGLRCPSCCGAGFLRRREVSAKGTPRIEQLTASCPDCSDVHHLHATIAAFVGAQLQAEAARG